MSKLPGLMCGSKKNINVGYSWAPHTWPGNRILPIRMTKSCDQENIYNNYFPLLMSNKQLRTPSICEAWHSLWNQLTEPNTPLDYKSINISLETRLRYAKYIQLLLQTFQAIRTLSFDSIVCIFYCYSMCYYHYHQVNITDKIFTCDQLMSVNMYTLYTCPLS